jgi:hypothetical protein
MLITPARAEFVPYPMPREGRAECKTLVEGEISPGVAFTLNIMRFERFATPRHRHPFSQVRFLLKGRFNYLPGKDIGEGHIGFFPGNTYYGPQQDVTCDVLFLQYGKGYLVEEQRRRAVREMRAGPSESADDVQRMYEHIHGKPLEYGAPAYAEPVIMDPSAFPWVPTADGVQMRTLGTLGIDNIKIEFVHLESSGHLQLDTGLADLIYVCSGSVHSGRDEVPTGHAAFSPTAEAVSLRSQSTAELLLIRIPVRH